ncbi:MAG: glycosyltransferase, partial [bacterium]
EIIVIDDRSKDRTYEIAESYARSYTQIKLLQIKDSSAYIAPKKRAIDFGIQQASGEIILTTDADCQPKSNWVAGMVKYFEADVGLVAGFNPYQANDDRVFNKILALDYFAMASVAAASIGLNFPISCSGGNLAYRKEVYHELGGFKDFSAWISGDDDFFLEQVREKSTWRIRYAIDPETHVPTLPPKNLREFVQQRIRYASKGRSYTAKVTAVLVGVYLMNTALVATGVFAFFNSTLFPAWALSVVLKSLAEFAFLRAAGKRLAVSFENPTFILTAFLHPIYILVIGLLGQTITFEWKGDRYGAKMPGAKTQRFGYTRI